MNEMAPMSAIIKRLLEQHPRLSALPMPSASQQSGLGQSLPGLAVLPPEILARLSCLDCAGSGRRWAVPGQDAPACKTCNGTGFGCPTCLGKRFVVAADDRADPQESRPRSFRCPDCLTWIMQMDNVSRYVAEQLAKLEEIAAA